MLSQVQSPAAAAAAVTAPPIPYNQTLPSLFLARKHFLNTSNTFCALVQLHRNPNCNSTTRVKQSKPVSLLCYAHARYCNGCRYNLFHVHLRGTLMHDFLTQIRSLVRKSHQRRTGSAKSNGKSTSTNIQHTGHIKPATAVGGLQREEPQYHGTCESMRRREVMWCNRKHQGDEEEECVPRLAENLGRLMKSGAIRKSVLPRIRYVCRSCIRIRLTYSITLGTAVSSAGTSSLSYTTSGAAYSLSNQLFLVLPTKYVESASLKTRSRDSTSK